MPGGFISRTLYSLKWQLELLKILWSESMSLKLFVVFCPCMSGEAQEADQQLVHKVRAGGEGQQKPAAELWGVHGQGQGLHPCPCTHRAEVSQVHDVTYGHFYNTWLFFYMFFFFPLSTIYF